jgi:hypothetical protein
MAGHRGAQKAEMVRREQKTGANFFQMTLIAKVGGLEVDLFDSIKNGKQTGCPTREKARLIVVRCWRALNNQIWLEVSTNSTGLCQ